MSSATQAGGTALEVRGLVKRFGGRVVIDGVDLSIPRGCAFGYLGPNGAGKTTLIRTVLGLIRADAGEVSILGHDMPEGRREALSRVGAIVDEPRFHAYLNGLQNLELLASARADHSAERIWPALERVGLADRAKDKVSKYSMGMRQRLGVASCLLADPHLLLLDEPMNGLDPAGMHEFRELILGLVAEGRTVLLSSHLLDEVQRTCEFVAIVDEGKIVVQGRISDLVAEQATSIRVLCDEPARAAEILGGLEGIEGVTVLGGPGASGPDGRSGPGGPDGRSGPGGPNGSGSEPSRAGGGMLGLTIRIAERWHPETMAAAVNSYLVRADISVNGLWVERASLEQRFLQLTSRLGQ